MKLQMQYRPLGMPNLLRHVLRLVFLLALCLFAKPASASDKASDALAIKAEHGPWLIMAKSFQGSDSKAKAEQLAAELRKDHKLQAYVLNKRFDFTKRLEGAGFDETGHERRMKYRDAKVVDSYAVLIGDFDSIDSPAITDALAKVKKLAPKCLPATEGSIDKQANTVDVNSYRNYLRKVLPMSDGSTAKESTSKPPLSGAFVTRNPLLPAEYYRAPELDKFVKNINEEKPLNEYSLLSCPGKFSVRVAVFRGDEVTESWGRQSGDSSKVDKIASLDLAAERATLTVRALRKAGYEAYQFHDRTQSYVTVGSFNELGKVDAQNKFVYETRIQEIIQRFGATNKVTHTKFGSSATPTLLFDLVDQKSLPELNTKDPKALGEWLGKYSVAFDLKPAPMAVPRMNTSSIYSGSLLGKDRR